MTKLLIWKCYHALIYIYRSYKQNGTIKVLPPLVVPISSLAHGLGRRDKRGGPGAQTFLLSLHRAAERYKLLLISVCTHRYKRHKCYYLET